MDHPSRAPVGDPKGWIVTALREEIMSDQPAHFVDFAKDVAARYGDAAVAVLFYGSCLRTRSTDGLLDFYVVVDGYGGTTLSAIAAAGARLLPPNVYHHRFDIDGQTLRAKVAVISVDQMRRRMTADAMDTTLWARFCQPTALLYARDVRVIDMVALLLAEAVLACAGWAARLGPDAGSPREYWLALFRASYAAELRVERADRAAELYEAAPERYNTMLSAAWRALGLGAIGDAQTLNPLPVELRRRSHRVWRRRRWGRYLLNALRLIKAAFTFDGGADYIAWKVERHSGRRIALSRLQHRYPLLAAPSLLWLLVRYRTLR